MNQQISKGKFKNLPFPLSPKSTSRFLWMPKKAINEFSQRKLGRENFSLIPILQHERTHNRYDTFALWQLQPKRWFVAIARALAVYEMCVMESHCLIPNYQGVQIAYDNGSALCYNLTIRYKFLVSISLAGILSFKLSYCPIHRRKFMCSPLCTFAPLSKPCL